MCKNASQKLNVVARLNNYLTDAQKVLLVNSVIKLPFIYCPLLWMFCSRSLNSLLNLIHERTLRLIYNDLVDSLKFSEYIFI